MLLGNWRNFDELESNLSYPELEAMVKSLREREQRNNHFLAALQGIDMNKGKTVDDPVERIKRKVRAKAAGVDEETMRFRENANTAGFKVISE